MSTIDPDGTVPRRYTQAGDYDLIRKMGSGGFGVVYEARHRHTGLMYAVKRIDLSPEDAERYRNEALYPARIASQSLHVLGVHSFFRDPGEDVFYLVTELIAHGDLRRFLDDRPKPLPLTQALDVAIGIAKGLAAIHAAGVVHRDLKPANVLMDHKDDRWVPKIADFGLARSTRSVSIGEFATSGYAAPEQMDLLSDQPLGPESDLFAFGMLLYELLTGEKATKTGDLREYGRWVGTRKMPPPASSVRPELARWPQLETLLASLLEFDRSKRLSDAGEVSRTLAQVQRRLEFTSTDEATAPPPPPGGAKVPPRAEQRSSGSGDNKRETPTAGPDARQQPSPTAEPGASPWTRARILAFMAVVFAVTGATMSYGLPWTNPGKFSPEAPELLYNTGAAPLYAIASWIVLPMLFGVAMALALGLTAVRLGIVAVVSTFAYQLVVGLLPLLMVTVLGKLDPSSRLSSILPYPIGAVVLGVGAVAIRLIFARWYRPSRRDLLICGAAGVVALLLLYLVGFLTRAVGVTFPGRTGFALNFVIWQVLVGIAIFNGIAFADGKVRGGLAWSPGPLIGLVVLALVFCGVGTWARSIPPPLNAGALKENPKDKANYAWIPPGAFDMGCVADDSECATDEQPQHKVTFTKGFWLRREEVTVNEWKTTPGERGAPPAAWQDTTQPVVNLTWQEAHDYCTAVDGRLPTEAEWEYAARAGTTGARYGRLNEIAFYAVNSGQKELAPSQLSDAALSEALAANRNTVHQDYKNSNAWGLYHMLGNAAEWVEDDYGDTTYSLAGVSLTDPRPHLSGVARAAKVVRGGSWGSRERDVRASARAMMPPDARSNFVGVRCVWNGPSDQ
jgi:formylglycine-generating enzyme required for sulfatase activity/serine/threonine protein kinase